MKLSVIGLGQCGCNIADEFYGVNDYARSFFHRRIEILTDAFAVNTDEADLGGFKNIPQDKEHRILIGNMSTYGHGVGKINTDAADIIRRNHNLVTDTILKSNKFHESDAIMAIASGGGGSGSGFLGYLVKSLKEKINKPVYAVVIFPFSFEEGGEISYAVINTATCVNTVSRYADAIFLVDNERYRQAGRNLSQTLQWINADIAGSFFDLCCAGEERTQKFVGSKVIDAGDIRQSLDGFTAIGRGEVALPTFRWFKPEYREGINEQGSVFSALELAENNSAVSYNLENARKILILITSPKGAVSVGTFDEIANSLNEKAPKAVIRIGDYPRRETEIVVTQVSSQLTSIPRLEQIFLKAETHMQKRDQIKLETEEKVAVLKAFGRNLPTLD
jgi:cell division GTPase FtsZ